MRKYKKTTGISEEQALKKLERYCAWQERCRQDVFAKLFQFEVAENKHKSILTHLEKEGFLNEKRYVSAVVRGKFNQNKWGKMKIKNYLLQKGIDENLIEKNMKEISKKDYLEVLKKLALEKQNSLKDKEEIIKILKTRQYLFNKGFEPENIDKVLK